MSDYPNVLYGPNTGFDLPSDVDLSSVAYPELYGAGGGVAAYRGPASAVAGDDVLAFQAAPGIDPERRDLNTAPGSVDLIEPRDTGGVPGTDTILASIGPVTGDGTEYLDGRARLNTPNPSYAGAVTGGPDFNQQAAQAYAASQAKLYSDQASASALLASF